LSEKKFSNHELYRGSAIPFLETNKFRLRVRAIQKTLPFGYRAKVLGRALLAVQDDPNRFWMLLSGNTEVAFPPRATTIAAAASLHTGTTILSHHPQCLGFESYHIEYYLDLLELYICLGHLFHASRLCDVRDVKDSLVNRD
jgi:hypothetical protein